jgi:hypothetical protein
MISLLVFLLFTIIPLQLLIIIIRSVQVLNYFDLLTLNLMLAVAKLHPTSYCLIGCCLGCSLEKLI